MTEYEALLRVTLAAVLGGVIGIERELAEKQAGLRTHALVALGAALFTVIGVMLTEAGFINENIIRLDPSRVIAGIVGGIGFLGAAVVFRDKDRAKGLTTAAGIWAVTGIGVATGMGSYILAAGAAAVIVAILYGLKLTERMMGTR